MRVLPVKSHDAVRGATHLLDLLQLELVSRVGGNVGLALCSTIIGHLKLRMLSETVVIFVKRRYQVLVSNCSPVSTKYNHVLAQIRYITRCPLGSTLEFVLIVSAVLQRLQILLVFLPVSIVQNLV